jgi:hypothetical protein
MRTKTKTAQAARDLRRKKTIASVVTSLEKTQDKLELQLKKLKKDLVMFRHYCDWRRSGLFDSDVPGVYTPTGRVAG